MVSCSHNVGILSLSLVITLYVLPMTASFSMGYEYGRGNAVIASVWPASLWIYSQISVVSWGHIMHVDWEEDAESGRRRTHGSLWNIYVPTCHHIWSWLTSVCDNCCFTLAFSITYQFLFGVSSEAVQTRWSLELQFSLLKLGQQN